MLKNISLPHNFIYSLSPISCKDVKCQIFIITNNSSHSTLLLPPYLTEALVSSSGSGGVFEDVVHVSGWIQERKTNRPNRTTSRLVIQHCSQTIWSMWRRVDDVYSRIDRQSALYGRRRVWVYLFARRRRLRLRTTRYTRIG